MSQDSHAAANPADEAGPADAAEPAAADKSPAGLFGLAVFLTTIIASGYFFHGREFANAETRWGLIRAIVDNHSLSIDPYHEKTIDKALVDGHYYCDKAPGSSFWGVPAYWLFEKVSGVLHRDVKEPDVRFATRIWVASLPTAVAAWLLYRLLLAQSLSAGAAAAVAVLSVLGTCAWPYATLLYGHQLAAVFVVAAFALLVDGQGPSSPPLGAWRILGAGLCIGCGVLTEYPVALAGGVLGVYALWRCRPPWRAAWFIVGGAPAAAALAAYNNAVFGSPWKIGYGAEAEQPFQAGMSEGLAGVTYPHLDSLWLITGSLARGLFSGSPFLLLALPGLAIAMSRAPRRSPWIVAAAIGLAFLLFNASYYMPDGGNACGPRHLLPAIPLMAMLCGGVLLPGCSRWWQVAMVGLAIPSVLRHLAATAIDPHVDPRALNPWQDFWWPLIEGGFHATTPLSGLGWPLWASLLVLAAVLAVIWLPLAPSGDDRKAAAAAEGAGAAKPSPWQGPAAYGLVAILSAAFIAPHFSRATPGPIQPLYVGTTLYNNGLTSAAMVQYERVIKMPIKSKTDRQFITLAWYNLGMMATRLRHNEEAVEYFQQAVKLDPRDKEVRHALAVALAQVGRIEEARRQLKAALEIDPEFQPARQSLQMLDRAQQ